MRIGSRGLTQPGWVIVGAIATLVCVGTACIYVTDTHYRAGNDGPINAGRQLVFVLVGLGAMAVVLRVGYYEIARHAYLIFALCVLLLVPLFVARLLHSSFGGLTAPRNGAYRWIHLPGYQLQPSEFMKIAYLIALAWYLRYRKNYRRLGGLVWPVAMSFLPLVLILVEPDLGTALLILPVLFAMLFMAGAKLRHLALIALVGIVAMPLAWSHIKPYQRLRITAVLLQSEGLRKAVIQDPERYRMLATKRQAIEWAASSGYQLVHSKNAVGSGGVLGHGWGNGVYTESDLLPDRHNDFVFALIGHQWGILGCLLVLGCHTLIVMAGVRIASVTKEPFAQLLAVGVVTLIAMQVIINIAMTVGLMPITGMTLPFVSYGGSSLLCNFIAAALLISISQHRPFLLADRAFEFGARSPARSPLEEYEDLLRD